MWRWPNQQQINIARGVQSNWKVNPPASLFFEQTIWLATAVPSVLRTNWTRSSPLLCRCRSTTNSCLLPRAVPYRGRRLSVRWNTRRQLMLFYRKDGSIALPWTFEWHPVFSKLPYFLCFLYIPGSNLKYRDWLHRLHPKATLYVIITIWAVQFQCSSVQHSANIVHPSIFAAVWKRVCLFWDWRVGGWWCPVGRDCRVCSFCGWRMRGRTSRSCRNRIGILRFPILSLLL